MSKISADLFMLRISDKLALSDDSAGGFLNKAKRVGKITAGVGALGLAGLAAHKIYRKINDPDKKYWKEVESTLDGMDPNSNEYKALKVQISLAKRQEMRAKKAV